MEEFDQQQGNEIKKDCEKENEQQNEQQLEDDQYEEIEYEEEEEVEQEIEQEELVPIQNEKEIDKDKEADILDDPAIPPRNCVSPSLVNSFHPPFKPILWARLLNDWQIDWEIQIQKDYPRSEEYIPLLKQDSGSKYYNVTQEPDKIQEKIDELRKKPTSSKKEKKEKSSSKNDQQQDRISSPQLIKQSQPGIGSNENVQPQKDKEKQDQDEEDNELLDPEVLKMRVQRGIVPSYQQFEEM
ncbi:MAG: hypothetical protein EZS28_046888, partial [Streblomastix strix]